MSSNLLLEHFDKLVDGGIDIPRFRKVIIAFAIQGELDAEQTTQAAIDAALRKIESARVALVAAGVVKKHKSLPPLGEDDIPFAISERTHCERLADVARIEKGLTGIQSAVPGAFPLVVTADARATCDHYDFDGCAAIVPMVSSAGHGKASLKRLHYQEGKFALGNILCAVFPFSEEVLSARFIFEYLSAYKDELLVTRMIGTANVSLTLNKIGEVPIPIVSKKTQSTVHELMALCDRLEAAQQQREAERTRLTAAAWQAVVQAEAPADVSFALEQLPALTTRPAQVKALRQTILDLAVRGRLVEQVEGDEPIANWLERHSLSEVTLHGRGSRSRSMDEPEIDEIPYAVPSGWEWVRMGRLGETNIGLTYSPQDLSTDGTPVLRSSNIQNGQLDFEDLVRVRTSVKESAMLQEGDLLICARNGSRALVGKVARVEDLPEPCAFGAFMAMFRSEMNPYLYVFISSPLFRRGLDDVNTMTINQITQSNLKATLVPVPPLAEQRRIMAKVEELMALCDGLEAALEAGEALRGQVLEAVVRSDDQLIRRSDNSPRPEVVQKPKVRALRYVEPEEEMEVAVAAEPVGSYGAAQVVAKRRPGRPRKSAAGGNGQVEAVIQNYLHAHPGWHGKAVLLEATGVDAGAWNAAIKELLEAGKVERQGEKKGARYRGAYH